MMMFVGDGEVQAVSVKSGSLMSWLFAPISRPGLRVVSEPFGRSQFQITFVVITNL